MRPQLWSHGSVETSSLRPGTKIYIVNIDGKFHTKFIFYLRLIYNRVYIGLIGILIFFINPVVEAQIRCHWLSRQ
jgi:hypothetical protein